MTFYGNVDNNRILTANRFFLTRGLIVLSKFLTGVGGRRSSAFQLTVPQAFPEGLVHTSDRSWLLITTAINTALKSHASLYSFLLLFLQELS